MELMILLHAIDTIPDISRDISDGLTLAAFAKKSMTYMYMIFNILAWIDSTFGKVNDPFDIEASMQTHTHLWTWSRVNAWKK